MNDPDTNSMQAEASEAVEQPAPAQPGKGRRGARRTLLPFRRHLPSDVLEEQAPPGSRWNIVLSAALLTTILSAIMLLPILPGQEGVQANTPATQDIYSPTDARYESDVLTERARQAAREDPANEVWVQNPEVVSRQRAMLMGNLSILDMGRGDETLYPGGHQAILRDLKGITLTEQLLNTILAMPDNEYAYWRDKAVVETFDTLMRDGRISSDADLQAVRAALPNRVPPYLSADPKAAAIIFLSPVLAVN